MGVRFEVGDIVTGNQSATERYAVTIRGAILEVVDVWADMIKVRVVGCDDCIASDSIRLAHDGRDPSRQIAMIKVDAIEKNTYRVQSEYFELTTRVSAEYARELNDFLDYM